MRDCSECGTPTACWVEREGEEVPRCMACHDAKARWLAEHGVWSNHEDHRERSDQAVRRMTVRFWPTGRAG